MANPQADYPAAIHDPIDISAKASSPLGSTPQKHSQVHGKIEEEIVEVQKKLGVGESDASSASTGQVLTKQSDGSTAWDDPTGGGGGGGAVDSVFGRTGAVVAADNDYEDTQIFVDDTDISTATGGSVTGSNVHAIFLSLIASFGATITSILTNLEDAFFISINTLDDITEGTTNKHFTATDETTLAGAEQTSNKGVANGYAELDSGGLVPTSQLPSYVDDVLSYANLAAFPVTGETGKIYVAEDTNLTYRWSGSAYVEISASLALGETSATAYRGDRGKIAYDHSQLTSGNPHNVSKSDVGLGNADNTADSAKNVLSATKLTTARNIDGQSFDGTANITVIAPGTHAASSKSTPVDADEMPLVDSAASNVLKKLTWANMKATLKAYFDSLYRTVQRVTFSNAAYVITATTDAVVSQIGTMSAPRTVTLPAANSVPAGTEIIVMDSSGTVTSTNTIVITRAGSDTINGATTDTISTAYGWRRLVSDGSSQWNIDAGIVRQSQIDTDATLLANSDTRVPSQKAMKTTLGNRWATQISLYKQPITGATARSAVAMVAGRAYFHMFQVPKPGVTTLTDILIELTTGSAATGRFAVYYITDGKDPANGITRIADLGTVDLTSTAVKETAVSQVLNYDWIVIGVYCPSASPVWRGLNSTAGLSHSAFQQVGYHSGALYAQDRPIVGWYVSSIDYSAGFPSSIASLTAAAGGAIATPLILARFSY